MPDLDVLPAATVTRGGVVESSHLAHVVVALPDGTATAITGDPDAVVYPRSALKPLQAIAIRGILADRGITMTPAQLAITSASHTGADDHQVEAAGVLAEADLDETALRCPPAWPDDDAVRGDLAGTTSLSHNCSGKHAGMLWAQTALEQPVERYLDPDGPLQQRIREVLAAELGEVPQGPGVDGCGAPAWRCSLSALARGFARLSEGGDGARVAVREAMVENPLLVGGQGLPDTGLMWGDARVVAKRGADGVMGCGFVHPEHGPLGVAVKVLDGGDRAAGPIAAAVLHALGARVEDAALRPPVCGGGQVQGHVQATPAVAAATTNAFGLA